MNNYTISLDDNELEYCRSQLKGYVRRLIQEDMALQNQPEPASPTKAKEPVAKTENQPKAVTAKREIDEDAFCMKHDVPERKIAGKCPKCKK